MSEKEQSDVYSFLQSLCQIPYFDTCSLILKQCRIGNYKSGIKHTLKLYQSKNIVGTGLLSGYAGEGMSQLTALNRTNKSWMQLL